MERNEIDYEVFVDCTPLHDDVPNDPVLEAMQNKRRRLKSFEGERSHVNEASAKPPLIYVHQTAEEDGVKVPAAVCGQLLVGRGGTKAGPRRRRHAARPPWLPPEWRVEKEPRSRGRKAGRLDSFFVDPKGNRFRSKKTVLRFLQTGVLPRRKASNRPNPAITNGGGEGGLMKEPAAGPPPQAP